MIFSNPNGADSYGAELEELQYNSGKRKFHTYSFNFLDKPGNTEQELEDAKAGKTRQQIESTLLAIRSLSDRSYLTSDEIEGSYDPKLQNLYGGQASYLLSGCRRKTRPVLSYWWVCRSRPC